MEFADELLKIAEDVEKHGFYDTEHDRLVKIASAKGALVAVNRIAAKDGFGRRFAEGLAQTAAIGLGVSVVGKAFDKIDKSIDEYKFNRKSKKIIEFAKEENPALRKVSNPKLKRWLESAYAVAPTVAKDPMLATTYLSTVHAVGGVDLNTAKTLAEIQSKGGQGYSKTYDAVTGATGLLQKNLVEV